MNKPAEHVRVGHSKEPQSDPQRKDCPDHVESVLLGEGPVVLEREYIRAKLQLTLDSGLSRGTGGPMSVNR